MPKRRCVFCRRWYKPYPAQASRQQTCGRAECCRKLKRMLNRVLERRHDGRNRAAVNRALRVWAKGFPGYWRHYRGTNPSYVARDNKRRARSLRRQRWGCSAKRES